MKKPSNTHTLFSRRSTPRRRERKRTALFDMSASFAASSSAGCLLLCLRTGFPWRRVPYCALFPRLLPVGAIIFPTKSTTDGANLTLQSSAALLMPAQVAQPPPPPPERRHRCHDLSCELLYPCSSVVTLLKYTRPNRRREVVRTRAYRAPPPQPLLPTGGADSGGTRRRRHRARPVNIKRETVPTWSLAHNH